MTKYTLEIRQFVGAWENRISYIKEQLLENENKEVKVLIECPGGYVSNGLAIASLFKDHGNVTVHIHGMTASAATIIAMGAKKIVISKNALFLVHQVMNWVNEWGMLNSSQMHEAIERLQKNIEDNDTIDNVIATMYADRSGKSVQEMKELMYQGKWIDAKTALDLGLVDEISNEGEFVVNNEATRGVINCFGLPALEGSKEESGIFEKIKELFFANPRITNNVNLKTESTENTAGIENDTNQNINNMEFKDLTNLNSCLAVNLFTANENNEIILTVDQLKVIENSMKVSSDANIALTGDKTNLTTQVTELTTQVENLKASGVDDTKDEHDNGKENNVRSVNDLMKTYKI